MKAEGAKITKLIDRWADYCMRRFGRSSRGHLICVSPFLGVLVIFLIILLVVWG